MKVTIAQEDLLESLKTVSRAVSSHNTLPVLGNVLLRAENKKLHLCATNLEISITTSCEAQVKNEGAITVPAKVITSYASLLSKKEEVELSVSSGNTLEIQSKTSKTKIKGIAADEFPQVTRVDAGAKLSLKGTDFRQAVQQVSFAAQEHSSRPILSGVLFTAKKDELKMVATDSYRLSEKSLKLGKAVEDVTSVLPVRAVMEADRLVGAAEGDITIVVGENQAMFTAGDTELVTRLIEGQFPDYEKIIPKESATKVEIDREELSLAVRRISIFARENNQHMKLEALQDGSVVVSTDSTQIGEDRATLPAKVEGENNSTALNADYVLDVLAALPQSEKVKIETLGKKNPLSPAVFRPQKGDDFLHLIMPLKM